MTFDTTLPASQAGDSTPFPTALALIERGLSCLLGLLMAALVLIVGAEVVARYVFGSSFIWTEELATWLFVALIFLGLPVGGGVLAEMSVDLLGSRLRPAARRWAQGAGEAIVLFTLAGLVAGAGEVVRTIGGVSTVLAMPESLRFGVVAAGGLLALATHLLRAAGAGRPVGIRLLFTLLALGAQVALIEGLVALPSAWSGSAIAAAVIAVAVLLAVPVPHAFLFGALLAVLGGGIQPAPAVVQNMVNGSSRFLLLAIPFFLLTGTLISAGNLSRYIVRFAETLVGHRRAGLAQTTLVTNSLFSCVSGSSVSDAALGAKLLVPQLIARGYPPPYAAALVASTAVLDNIIPPSVAFLILAAATQLSVADLWLAGAGGGLFLAAALALAIHLIGEKWNGNQRRAPATWTQRGQALAQALPVVGLAILIVAGIRFGAFTPTEAGVVTAVYALGIGLFYYRDYGIREVFGLFRQAGVETSSVGLLIGTAAPMGFLLAVDQVPQALTQALGPLGTSPVAVAVGTVALLLLVGCFLDIGAALLIFGPLLLPLALQAGFDGVHFGLVVVVTLMIGGLTPPVGVLVYVVSGTTGIRAASVFKACWPLILALLAGLVAIIAFPRAALIFV